MKTVADLVQAMRGIAPEWLAESWDNVGLIVGDEAASLGKGVLLAIDLTDAVVAEAESSGAGAVVAYHPPVFHPIKRLVASDARQGVVLRAARAGIALYSPHTALDAATGGMSDWLADIVLTAPSTPPQSPGASRTVATADRRALRPALLRPPAQRYKVVTFVPAADVERVRGSLASAGAGIIGDYSVCSFAVEGTGTFLGAPSTKPAVGAPGRLESVPEVRLEMVVSKAALALAMETLRQFHPYQEPAVDLYELVPRPSRAAGVGRRMTLDRPIALGDVVDRVKRNLGLGVVSLAPGAGRSLSTAVTTIGVCPGSGGQVAELALAEGCEVFVTGEMSHHEVLRLTSMGLTIVLAGHTATERGYLPLLAERLRTSGLLGVPVAVSTADRDPAAPR